MKTPDRFEKKVLKKSTPDFLIGTHDAIALLRREHAWVVRMVKDGLAQCTEAEKHHRFLDGMKSYGWNCRAAQCQEILNKLAKRRK